MGPIRQRVELAARDAIALRAYELFEERGREPGRDVDDWLKAPTVSASSAATRSPKRASEHFRSQCGAGIVKKLVRRPSCVSACRSAAALQRFVNMVN